MNTRYAFALFLLAACTDKADDNDNDSGDSDTIGDTGDSNTTDDTDDSDTTDDSGLSACGDFAPFDEVGLKLTYHYTQEYQDANGIVGEWTITYAGPTGGDGHYTSNGTFTYEAAGVSDYWSETENEVYCDDTGVYGVSWHNETEYTSGTSKIDMWSTGVYREPWPLTIPATLSVGHTWTSEGTYDYENSYGSSDTETFTTDYEVLEVTERTVPAGTFDAVRVLNSRGETSWYAEGIGMIEIEGLYELVAVD